ncbi:alpha-mannosyltransferase [Aspergillus clavatus NRRL 1]|uniref:Alpha-1,2-mannosyltransferase n=1 Tax=Aspergillus clavatus (strain ATCC 1007 / CBS 513.65 / DSM 816 / NCTC 3887 / NRRL 1 / QM 1276 / 107) TaxID=344612 RepID=A1C9B6_ASPCL|nr:uncharacterized protein ACLA_054870 [Aspergillus clavatus NRRL 1]EAW13440.1 conserved hypothetical protein [Aspergillus clavatus NRRL 1]
MWKLRQRGLSRKLFATLLALFLIIILLREVNLYISATSRRSFLERRASLWDRLHPLLEANRPNCPSPVLHGSAGTPRFDPVNDTPRPNYISNSDELQGPLQTTHDSVIRAIRDLPLDRAYIPRTKGIVSAAGGTYLPTFVVSLRMLRRTGSKLPVEIFVKDSAEYEPYICEEVLPALGANCLVLSDVLASQGSTGSSRNIEHFQIKSFAILFSSFEKVLWLDADCVPLHDPSTLLGSEPFTSAGLVSWPDFWANTASPLYFNISRQPELAMTARPATEAGMLLVSKRDHFLTLLLAAYYNYYGPSHYYPLLDQGAPGEGDKDTFIQAAAVLGEKYYVVQEPVSDLGHPASDGGVIGAAMLHADPIQDYYSSQPTKWYRKSRVADQPPRGFFVHAYSPEFNPGEDLLGPKSRNRDGSPGRVWTAPKKAIQRFGYDVEKAYWEEAKTVGCTLEHSFGTWESKSGVCSGVQAHWKAVFEDRSAENPMFTTEDSPVF